MKQQSTATQTMMVDSTYQAYDSTPWWYDVRGFFILKFAYRGSLLRQVQLFSSNIGRHHLEVACGSGTLLDLALRWRTLKRAAPARVVAFDYAEPMLVGARHRFRRRSDVEVHHADAAHLAFPEASFDTANIANAVHCFPDVDASLAEIARVLKPNGTLVLNVLLFPPEHGLLNRIAQRINTWGRHKGILYTPYDADDIRHRCMNSGFTIEHETRSGNCLDLVLRKPPVASTGVLS